MGLISQQASSKMNVSDNSPDPYVGLSRNASIFRILYESAKVRLIIWKRYRAEFYGSLIQIFILTAFFFLFATAVGFRGYEQFGTKEVFIFFLSGFMVMLFDGVTIWTPLNTTTRDLYNGTLEYLYFSPHRKFPYFGGYMLGTVIVSSLAGFLPMFTLLIWYAEMSAVNTIMVLITISVLMLSFLSFGIIIGLSAMMWKQVQSLASLLGLVMQFFTGGFIPIASMPEVLRYIGYLFPHTWGYELIRYYAFNGNWQTILPVELNWILLVVFFVIYTIAAIYLHKKVVKHSKTKGLHLI